MASKYILLVEDEAPKRKHIESFLGELDDSLHLEMAMSVTAALESIESRVPDLLLLDMSLPTYDVGERERGGRPQGFGGVEVLRYLSMADISCPVIVITGYEAFMREDGPLDLGQLRAELQQEFPYLLKAVLHYNSTFEEWRTELAKVMLD